MATHPAPTLLWPATDVWPGPELDLVEVGFDGSAYSTIHFKAADGSNGYTPYTLPGVDPTKPHLYAMDWQADHIAAYVDNQQMYSTTVDVPKDAAHGSENSAPGFGIQTWWSVGAQTGDNHITAYDVTYAAANGTYRSGLANGTAPKPDPGPGSAAAVRFGVPGTWGQQADVWEGQASFGGTGYHTFGGTADWGGLQAAQTAWAAGFATRLAFDNIGQLSLDLHAAGTTGLDLMAVSAKYGSITTGNGNDTVTWVAHSNAAGGNNTVHVTAVALSPLADYDRTGNGSLYDAACAGKYSTADVRLGGGIDTVEGSVRLVLHGGDGLSTARGGARNDWYVLNHGNGHVTIEGFASSQDHLKFIASTAATQDGVAGLLVTYDDAGDRVFLAIQQALRCRPRLRLIGRRPR